MPHPLHAKADGQMVYTVPVIIFMDDALANISKQWNKHIVVYLSNAGLPWEMLDKEFCMHFITSSLNALPMELMRAVWDLMDKALDSPVVTYNCKTRKEIMIIPYLIFTASDNPMHAEQTSQCGLNANYFCRTCHVGGTKVYKKTDEGFGKVFKIGQICDLDNTQREIEQQPELCVLPGGTDKVESAAQSSGIKDGQSCQFLATLLLKGRHFAARKLEALLKKSGIKPLIGMPGFSIHLDTPTEILHTVLLGVVKYFCAQMIWYLKNCSKSLTLFRTCLASVKWNGLNVPSTNAEYICQYHNSLIGKHFKSLAQVMPFLIYDLVTQDVMHAWNIIGALIVLRWDTEIEDLESYLVSLSSHSNCITPKTQNRHLYHGLLTIFSILQQSAHQASLSQSQSSIFLSIFWHSSIALALQLSSQLSAMNHLIMYSACHVSLAIDKHPVMTAAMCLQHRIALNTSPWGLLV
ncbi:hypothetical protein EI94DRAFT_1616106 [Lactarius quietus]|nr:hypothetical protein EI94DRAFT_1616106 [Lactarius quietus]